MINIIDALWDRFLAFFGLARIERLDHALGNAAWWRAEAALTEATRRDFRWTNRTKIDTRRRIRHDRSRRLRRSPRAARACAAH